MTTPPTDGALVAARVGGDQAALAAIYDRYADRLHDTAMAMLRDRDEAADAVQEVFLVAASKLGQLRDPERLKPWLFAVLRNDVYRRTKLRGRSRPTDFSLPEVGEVVAPTDPIAEGAGVEHAELAALVRAAAAGLDERDQLVLELSVRQDMGGDDLAAAVGVTTSQAHVLVHRMRDRLTRSMGAYTVARLGRGDCPELDGILAGWDGEYSVLIRKRVARHVERCEICEDTRSRKGAVAMFGAAPALAAPTDLRDAVLVAASRGVAPAHAIDFDADGFPRPPRRRRTAPLGRVLAIAAALLVLALVAGTAIAGDDAATDVAASATSTTTPPPSDGTDAPTTTTASTTTTTATPADAGPATSAPGLGTAPPAAPATTAIAPPTTAVPVTDPTGSTVTTSTTSTTAPPRTPAPETDPPRVTITVGPASMTCTPPATARIAADVADASAIDSVVLRWTGPGAPGQATMTSNDGVTWSGVFAPARVDGAWTYEVVATDVHGNVGTASRRVVLSGCSGGFATP